ncbi:MAG: hypothetical protein K2M17_01680 [Bacilli bacterium]|nr:hypothetical protein [Bacilli bacterium]
MKTIKINGFTLYFLCLAFLCGYIKTALIILGIVVFHELGHVFFIHLFHYKTLEITIYPFGGITKVEKDINIPLYQEFLIAIGGVLFQMILFLILLLPLREYLCSIFLKYNIAILCFNLLPIIPLDGSIILNTVLNRVFSYKKSYQIYCGISILFIISYFLFNIWSALNNYLIITLFLYKTYEALKNYKYLYNKFLLERFLYDYKWKHISTKKGNLDILKRETYQYFKEENGIVSEKKKLAQRFDKP